MEAGRSMHHPVDFTCPRGAAFFARGHLTHQGFPLIFPYDSGRSPCSGYGDPGTDQSSGQAAMYFVTTKTGEKTVTGKMPFTAANVLAFIKTIDGSGVTIEVHDKNGNLVSIEQLRKEAGR